MKYLAWFVRLLFGSWMVANGLNHFVYLWPQSMGDTPLAREFTVALIDSHLFDIVKLVEVVAGVSVLTGVYAPLMVLVCMPVSFVVFYYGEALEHARTHHGFIVVACNLVLALSYFRTYRAMLTPRARLSAAAWRIPQLAPSGLGPAGGGRT